MTPNNQEPIEDLFAFYALGTLSEEERERVEAHIEEHPAAQEQLLEMMDVVSALGHIPDPIKPRNQVLEGVLNRIRAGPREAQKAESGPLARPGIIGWIGHNRATTALAILSLLIVIVSASWAVTRNAQIVELQGELAGLQATIAQQNEIISRISLPRVQAVEVPGTEEGSEASGRLFGNPEASSGVLFAWGLTPLSPEESYQVWLIAGENPVSAGLLPVQDLGRFGHLIEAGGALKSFDAIGVSIEPLGGSSLPTGPIVLFAGLAD